MFTFAYAMSVNIVETCLNSQGALSAKVLDVCKNFCCTTLINGV